MTTHRLPPSKATVRVGVIDASTDPRH
ncbi:uncharacterized protein METZ01_LOCUS2218 [marine metagenome]|uniref:Uncharacterized protein n=1 Tax=marine metagenome TaxID=408172 RepID=A0A381N5N2_9ZZZZ